MRNLDRGGFRKKPNLLVRNRDFLLIDHEQIFPFADDPDHYNDAPFLDLKNGSWRYPFEYHLFFPYLKTLPEPQKSTIFATFAEQLRQLDPFLLEEPAQYLTEIGQPVGNLELIADYLSTMQQASKAFVSILQQQISP